jgi:hypothetical protein
MTNSLTLEAIESLSFLSLAGQFILQCGAATANDALKLRILPLSLSGTAFT